MLAGGEGGIDRCNKHQHGEGRKGNYKGLIGRRGGRPLEMGSLLTVALDQFIDVHLFHGHFVMSLFKSSSILRVLHRLSGVRSQRLARKRQIWNPTYRCVECVNYE